MRLMDFSKQLPTGLGTPTARLAVFIKFCEYRRAEANDQRVFRDGELVILAQERHEQPSL